MNDQNKTSFSITSDYDSISENEVFSKLLKVLMAYSLKLIGDSTLRLSKNKAELAYDFSMEAIRRHLEDVSKFDSTRNSDLVKYLKYNILRRLISNHKTLDGQKREVLYENHDVNGIKVDNSSDEVFDIHIRIDLQHTLDKIRSEVGSDLDLLSVFELRYVEDYKPSEVMEELQITSRDYNNRIRRVDTIRIRVINEIQQKN